IPIFAVGDKISDVEFGRNAGGTGLLVLTGLGAGERSAAEDLTPPAPVVEDLWDSAHWILNDLILRESGDEVLAAKLRTPGQLAGEVLRRKAAGLRTVFTNGCFDLVHGGHV